MDINTDFCIYFSCFPHTSGAFFSAELTHQGGATYTEPYKAVRIIEQPVLFKIIDIFVALSYFIFSEHSKIIRKEFHH